jgi:hypothetical protein
LVDVSIAAWLRVDEQLGFTPELCGDCVTMNNSSMKSNLSHLMFYSAILTALCGLYGHGADSSKPIPLENPVTIEHFTGFMQLGNHEFAIPSKRSCGMSWVRMPLWWYFDARGAERSEGRWDWSGLDQPVRLARENGMSVIGVLGTYPPWQLQRSKDGMNEKELLAAWGDYVRRVAKHYRVDPLKVDIFEIINEANGGEFIQPYLEIFRVPKPWTTEKCAALYARLYRTAYKAIKAVHPKAVISSTGTSGMDIEFHRRFFDCLRRSEYPDMNTNATLSMKEDKSGFLVRSMRALVRPIWTPEADESRFLLGINIIMFLIMPLWGKGILTFMGTNPVLVTFAVGWIVYLILFWKRLRHRGELGRVIVAPAVFIALLLGVSFY